MCLLNVVLGDESVEICTRLWSFLPLHGSGIPPLVPLDEDSIPAIYCENFTYPETELKKGEMVAFCCPFLLPLSPSFLPHSFPLCSPHPLLLSSFSFPFFFLFLSPLVFELTELVHR